MESELRYIVYITINLCNGKFYIGVHRTNPKVFDGYIGCGTYNNHPTNDTAFCNAVKKYGYSNFRRTTIKVFPDSEEGKEQAYALEKILVNETLIKSKYVYNECLGGICNRTPDSHKKVYMFDLKGNYLRSFKCCQDAAIYLNVLDIYSTTKAIQNCCLGTSKSSFDYYWSYTKKFDYKGTKNLTPVAQYTYSGKFLKHFDSITEAENELHCCTIHQAVTKHILAAGYQWRYFTGDTRNIHPLISNSIKNKVIPVIMYDKQGKVLGEYSSINECVNSNPQYKFTSSQIQRVCKHIIKSHKGFVFKFKDEDIVLSDQK